MKEFEALAVILWGLLAIVLLFLLSVHVGSFPGAVLSVSAAGFTYLFQAVQFEAQTVGRKGLFALAVLQLIPVLLFIAALVLIVLGY